MNAEWKPEQVGRRYEYTRFALLHRKVGGDGAWYGLETYKSLDEAQDALRKCGKRYMSLGGLTVDLGDDGEMYERKIVKVIKQCEVIEVAVTK